MHHVGQMVGHNSASYLLVAKQRIPKREDAIPPYSKCQISCPNSPENPLFKKSRFSGPFRQKLLTYSEIMLASFRSLSGAPDCNKVPKKTQLSANTITDLPDCDKIPERGRARPGGIGSDAAFVKQEFCTNAKEHRCRQSLTRAGLPNRPRKLRQPLLSIQRDRHRQRQHATQGLFCR
jgi:hypothetical protein